MPAPQRYSVVVSKDYLKFSAALFHYRYTYLLRIAFRRLDDARK